MQACINRLASITVRDPVLVDIKARCATFLFFNRAQLEDNWYHVRKLLQALKLVDGAAAVPQLHDLELDLILVLSACQAGAADVLPWLVVLDILLRDTWRAVSTQLREFHGMSFSPALRNLISERTPSLVNNKTQTATAERCIAQCFNLFDELCLFARATAVNAVIIRYPEISLWRETKRLDIMVKFPKAQHCDPPLTDEGRVVPESV